MCMVITSHASMATPAVLPHLVVTPSPLPASAVRHHCSKFEFDHARLGGRRPHRRLVPPSPWPPPRPGSLHREVLLVLLLAVAAILLEGPQPTLSSSSPGGAATAALEPTLTYCSGQSPYFTSSSPVVTSGEFASFLDAVSAGAAGSRGSMMSHNMSSRVAENRTMYGIAQCRPDVPVADCAACLAASSRLMMARTAAAACASAAVWHDACFLRYSDQDPSRRFREDEYTATVFNASSSSSHGGGNNNAVVTVITGLLAAAGNGTVSSYMCRGVGAGTTTTAAAAGGGGGGQTIYGLTRCAAGVACGDCGRCLRGAVAMAEKEYNGSAGMQVLRLSCMARYESYPFYNAASLQQMAGGHYQRVPAVVTINGNTTVAQAGAGAPHPTPAPPPPGKVTNRPFEAHGAPYVRAFAPAPAPRPTPAPPGGHVPAAVLPPAVAVPPAGPAESPSSMSRKSFPMLIVAAATRGGVVIAVILLLIICWCRRKQPLQMDAMQEKAMYVQEEHYLSIDEEDDGEKTSCQVYSYQVLKAATCHFSNSNKLGSGGFGTVYKGTLENGKEVAVKRFRDSKKNIQELEREISIVSNLRHRNLMRFLGYCFEEEERFLVYEYVRNNSLEKFWYKASFQCHKLEWGAWFNIIKGVARGLRFLHEKGIIHRDLKPHNVLLDENFNPKIADFDLMRAYDKLKTHESTEKVAGTFGYMAPECTSGRKFLLSIKSDVYSYGVLVLEIITGHKIHTFEGQNSEGLVEHVWQHWREKRARDVLDGDLGLGVAEQEQERALRQALRCVHVALLCVQSERSARPTMGQVIAMLDDGDVAATTTMQLPEPSLPGYVMRPTTAATAAACGGGVLGGVKSWLVKEGIA